MDNGLAEAAELKAIEKVQGRAASWCCMLPYCLLRGLHCTATPPAAAACLPAGRCAATTNPGLLCTQFLGPLCCLHGLNPVAMPPPACPQNQRCHPKPTMPPQEVKGEIDGAIEEAKAAAVPEAPELWTHVYEGGCRPRASPFGCA